MQTEKGRLCYRMNLQQIRNAVLETIYYGGIEALLTAPTFDRVWQAKHGQSRDPATRQRAMDYERDQWACVQTNEHGWDLLDSRKKREMMDGGNKPDTIVVPPGMKVRYLFLFLSWFGF